MYVSVPKTCSSSVSLNAQHLPAAVRVIEAVQGHPINSLCLSCLTQVLWVLLA